MLVQRTYFLQVEQIQISDMHHQAHGYFLLLCIVNVVNKVIPDPLLVSSLQKLSKNEQEVQYFYDRVRSDMILIKLIFQLQIPLLINSGLIEGNINGLTLGVS